MISLQLVLFFVTFGEYVSSFNFFYKCNETEDANRPVQQEYGPKRISLQCSMIGCDVQATYTYTFSQSFSRN